jgi:hypothetical protein
MLSIGVYNPRTLEPVSYARILIGKGSFFKKNPIPKDIILATGLVDLAGWFTYKLEDETPLHVTIRIRIDNKDGYSYKPFEKEEIVTNQTTLRFALEPDILKELTPEPVHQEYLMCSAIHYQDKGMYSHQPKNIKSGFVVCGRRHHNCLATVGLLKGKTSIETVQGFLTNEDNFVDREEAARIAKNNGILSFVSKNTLTSEDLWP